MRVSLAALWIYSIKFKRARWYNLVMAYIRRFKTGSGATGVQVCYKEHGKVVKTVHVGSANSEQGIEKLLKKAQKIMDADKLPLFSLEELDRKNKNLR